MLCLSAALCTVAKLCKTGIDPTLDDGAKLASAAEDDNDNVQGDDELA